MERKSIIKQSSAIRNALKKRFDGMSISYSAITRDAEAMGFNGIKIEMLSRYFKGNQRGSLSEEAIIFLAFRYGIPVTLNVGRLRINDTKVETYIPEYHEETCKDTVRKIFGLTQTVAIE